LYDLVWALKQNNDSESNDYFFFFLCRDTHYQRSLVLFCSSLFFCSIIMLLLSEVMQAKLIVCIPFAGWLIVLIQNLLNRNLIQMMNCLNDHLFWTRIARE
jgi:hypothetical protein